MSKWRLIEQTEKNKKEEISVKCKHLRFFPIQNGGETAFGRFKFMMLRVIVRHEDEGKDHVITYNDRGGKDTFIYHWPSVKVQGQDSFTSLQRLHDFLKSRGDIADQVVDAFKERMSGVAALREDQEKAKQAKIAAKQAKELAKIAKQEAKAAKKKAA